MSSDVMKVLEKYERIVKTYEEATEANDEAYAALQEVVCLRIKAIEDQLLLLKQDMAILTTKRNPPKMDVAQLIAT